MKKVLGLVFLVLTVFLASCTKTKPTLTFESTNINIKVNEEFTLTPTITNGKKGAKVIYEVLDDTVLSYQDGKFKGLKVGTTKIDAQIENVKDTKVEINVTVEAEIIPSYSITYHLNGGVNPANAPTTFIEADLPITLPSPTKDGYDFLGWFNNSAFTGDALTTIPAGSKQNISLYANWDEEEVSASITYNLNGGTNNPEAQATYTNKQLPYTLEIPTRQGYVFVGWYKDSAFINE
ncbi:MAG: InlB B-repeat-containing protein, partial [Bacilli bacterium]